MMVNSFEDCIEEFHLVRKTLRHAFKNLRDYVDTRDDKLPWNYYVEVGKIRRSLRRITEEMYKVRYMRV